MYKMLDKVKRGSIIWTSTNVLELVRNEPSMEYLENKMVEMKKFAYWLSEGLIECSIKGFEVQGVPTRYSFDIKKALEENTHFNEVEKEAYINILDTSSNLNQLKIKFDVWKMLSALGCSGFEYKKRTYSMYAKEPGIMIQLGDGNINHIIKSFIEGIKQYILLPHGSDNDEEMIIFNRTNQFDEFMCEKENEIKELQDFFLQSRVEGKKATNERKSVSSGFQVEDLIEYKQGNKNVRGIVVMRMEKGVRGIRKAKLLFEQEQELLDELKRSGINKHVNFKWKLKEVDNKGSMLLVKQPKETAAGVTMDFINVNEADVIHHIHQTPECFMNRAQQVFEKTNDRKLKLQFKYEDDNTLNGSYDPQKHLITLYLENATMYGVHRYIHDGILPVDTIEMVIAHELGHADKEAQYLYEEKSLLTLIERINGLYRTINEVWQDIFFNQVEKSVVEETLSHLEETLKLVEEFKGLYLLGEKDAFKYGIKYISDYLHPVFEREAYEHYLNYEEQNEQRIREINEQINMLKEVLIGYKKSDFIIDLTQLFKAII